MAVNELIKNKKYQIIVSFRDDDNRPRNIKRVFYGTHKEALLQEAKLSIGLENGIEVDITFSKLFKEYLQTKKSDVTNNTVRKEKEIYSKYLKSISRKKVKNLTYKDILRLRSNIDAAGGTSNQKNKSIYLFKRICRFGYKAHDIKNISDDLLLFKKPAEERTIYNTLTPEELYYILDFEDNNMFKLIYELYYWTGMRRGCLLGLFKQDVLSTKQLDIYNSVNDKGVLGPPKNESSYRKIKIHDDLYNKLKPYVNRPGTYLFGDKSPIGATTINRRFMIAIKKANKKLSKDKNAVEIPHIRIHDLRHSHATYLASKGVPIAAISARLGHSSVYETMKTYTHLFKGDDDLIIEVIEEALSDYNVQKKSD